MPKEGSQTLALVFSMSRRRPGCALLQAAMGGTIGNDEFVRLFPHETWLVSPTDDMQAYEVDPELLERISATVRNERGLK